VGADSALSFGAQSSDIGNIPAIAIENLQILRDGATAQYGSDAIGGVLNYQIRKDAGFEGQVIYGQTGEGDGTTKQISAKRGAKLDGNGFVMVAGEWFDGEGTSRGATRPAAAEIVRLNPTLANSIPNAPGGPAQIWGSSPSKGWKSFLNAGLDVGDQGRLYLTANFANSDADQSFNYRPPITVTGLQANNGSGTPVSLSNSRNGSFNPIYLTPCPTGNATCPAGGFVNDTNTFSFTSLYPGGFTPRFLGTVDQAFVSGGFKGELSSGMTYDFSANVARNSLTLGMNQSLSPSYGPQSQTSFNFGKLIRKRASTQCRLHLSRGRRTASPVTLSFGAEYRKEEYEKTVGDLQSYGAGPYARQQLYNLVRLGVYTIGSVVTQSPAASGYGGVSPNFAGKVSQSNYGLYTGAETDFTDKLGVGVAVRFEDYSTFGSTVVGKLNALYKATDTFFVAGNRRHRLSRSLARSKIIRRS
jgi:iron complex outermembrane receptor protein